MDGISFDITKLAQVINEKCLGVSFAFLHGSAINGFVKKGSDLDIGIYCSSNESKDWWDAKSAVIRTVWDVVEIDDIDVGILNRTEPVYKFEVLKGKKLFVRDTELYYGFFSLTCREYEDAIFHYERQKKYRLKP